MIPRLITAGYRGDGGRLRRVHLPVVPVALLLSPLLLLALVGGFIAGRIFRISAWGALRATGRLLWALPGAVVDIDDGRTTIQINIK